MVLFIEKEVTFFRLAFRPQNELSLFLFVGVSYSGGAGLGPLASRARKVENTVGGLGRRLEAQKVVQPFLDDIPALQHRQSTLATCADDAQRRSAVKSSPRSEI